MKRDVAQLAERAYDLVIIGGGISGAFVAWDASLRGLSVALIERGDFGHATSANSLKTIHGGLRYLQDADPRLVRLMIKERTALLRIAPHLVHPLPCLMPTYGHGFKSRAAMTAALAINDLLGFDRNTGLPAGQFLPQSRVISRSACRALLPGLPADGLTGAALWHDAQVDNTERLTLSVVLSAARAGASVANYVAARSLLHDGTSVYGVQAVDALTAAGLTIRAACVVNATGAWGDELLAPLRRTPHRTFPLSTAMNIVTRQIIRGYAAGLPSRYDSSTGRARRKARLLFVSPWRSSSIIGTVHRPYAGHPDSFAASESDVQGLIEEVNHAYPSAALTLDDVQFVHQGFLPAASASGAGDVKLVRKSQIYDHRRVDAIEGLITLVGVKYTTARASAQATVDLVLAKLGREPVPCATHVTPLDGNSRQTRDVAMKGVGPAGMTGVNERDRRRLIRNYGTHAAQVLLYLPDRQRSIAPFDSNQVLEAEVRYAVRAELAQKLTDVIFRRTDLGTAGVPRRSDLCQCAATMGQLLGWSEARRRQELEEVHAALQRRRLPLTVVDQEGMAWKSAETVLDIVN